MSLIKMQLNDMAKWTVTSYGLEGTDSMNYTYTYYQMLYVMEPVEESVEQTIELCQHIRINIKITQGFWNSCVFFQKKIKNIAHDINIFVFLHRERYKSASNGIRAT